MTNVFNLQRGAVGNKPCPICNTMHVPQNKCDNTALAKRVQMLIEANQAIPGLMKSNKEAVEIAQYLQGLVQQADYAQTLIQEILVEHGDLGKTILAKYHERLNKWAAELLNQNTQQETPSIEQSTSNGTDGKSSTLAPDGASSPLILSP